MPEIVVTSPGSATTGNPTFGREGVAPEFEGPYAIDRPTVTGDLQRLILLDDEWVICVYDVVPSVFSEIDTATVGALQSETDTWLSDISWEGTTQTWSARTGRWAKVKANMAAARDAVELPLGDTANFTISSSDDANYSPAVAPSVANRIINSAGGSRYGPAATRNNRGRGYTERDSGVFVVDWLVYSYIKFPTRMVDGSTYTITGTVGGAVTFEYDLNKSVSRAIKINQNGYLPDAGTKHAYVGGHLWGEGVLDLSHTSTFEVVNIATGNVELSGTVTLAEADPPFNRILDSGTTDGVATDKLIDNGQDFLTSIYPSLEEGYVEVTNDTDSTTALVTNKDSNSQLSLDADIFTSGEDYTIRYIKPLYGEDVYRCDFSALTAEGWFFIRIPGVGRSWPFRHDPDVYSRAFYTAARGMYHQRFNTVIGPPYSNWYRERPHITEAYFCEHITSPRHNPNAVANNYINNEQNMIAATIDTSIRHELVEGGHCDAGDWDLREQHFTCVLDLLYAFEFFGSKLTDNQLNIPESGNGIPDLLGEARYGLEQWRNLQTPEGGIGADVETNAHWPIDNRNSSGVPQDWGVSQPVSWDSLMYAAAAAMYARLVTPYDSADAAVYEASATAAYNWGIDPANRYGPNHVLNDGGSPTVTWTEIDDDSDRQLMFAKLQMFLLTDTASYITTSPDISTLETRIGAQSTASEPYEWYFTVYDWSPWLWYSIIQANDAGAPGLSTLATTWETNFLATADSWITRLTGKPYENTMSRIILENQMAWGATWSPNYNRAMIIADQLSVDSKYRDAAIQNMDWCFGANPLGISWMTGIGYVYPIDIQHEPSHNKGMRRNGDPVRTDPFPGIGVLGVNGAGHFAELYDTEAGAGLKEGFVMRALPESPASETITALSQTGGTATATSAGHGRSVGDQVWVIQADAGYNGNITITGVPNTDDFEYAVDSSLGSPASASGKWKKSYITDFKQQRNYMPIWRAFFPHPQYLVSQNEFTIDATMTPTVLSCAFLMSSGWSPDGTEKTQPRNEDELHGRWLLP